MPTGDAPEPPLKVGLIPVTPFVQNCSLLICTATKKAALVDPGGEADKIAQVLEQQGVTLEKIFLTHGHMDHAGAAAELAERFHVPIEGPAKGDKFWLDELEEHGARYGVAGARNCAPDRWLEDGDTVSFGQITLDVLFCPGHTPGHVVFYHAPSRLAIVGDVLFQGSVGRTDLPQGDHDTLIRSITRKLWPLGDDITFISGHGPTSTFGQERRTNPFVSDKALQGASYK